MFGNLGGGDRHLFNDVASLVESWVPERAYRRERRFRDDLQDYLDDSLNNSQRGDPLGLGQSSNGQKHVVSVEHGELNADVCVDGEIAIELKRDLSNSQTSKLHGQLARYGKHYPFVIGCACGIDDIDGWRELQNEFGSRGGFDIAGGSQAEYVLIHKEKRNFGSRGGNQDNSGVFGGGLF